MENGASRTRFSRELPAFNNTTLLNAKGIEGEREEGEYSRHSRPPSDCQNLSAELCLCVCVCTSGSSSSSDELPSLRRRNSITLANYTLSEPD